MGYKRTGLLLTFSAFLASFVPLSQATKPQTPKTTRKAPPITDTLSLGEFSDKEIEKASLESVVSSQKESGLEAIDASTRDIGALILSCVGWLSNAALEAILHPLELSKTIWRLLKFLPFVSSTGLLKELMRILFMICKHPQTLEQTAAIQTRLANRRRADCAIQGTITESVKQQLLADSKRYFKFATAAYGIPQMLASELLHPTKKRTMGITQTIDYFVVGKIATHLGIPRNQILYLTPVSGSLSNSYHFVAVDLKTESVVLAIRGTNSLSELCVDAMASTGT